MHCTKKTFIVLRRLVWGHFKYKGTLKCVSVHVATHELCLPTYSKGRLQLPKKGTELEIHSHWHTSTLKYLPVTFTKGPLSNPTYVRRYQVIVQITWNLSLNVLPPQEEREHVPWDKWSIQVEVHLHDKYYSLSQSLWYHLHQEGHLLAWKNTYDG